MRDVGEVEVEAEAQTTMMVTRLLVATAISATQNNYLPIMNTSGSGWPVGTTRGDDAARGGGAGQRKVVKLEEAEVSWVKRPAADERQNDNGARTVAWMQGHCRRHSLSTGRHWDEADGAKLASMRAAAKTPLLPQPSTAGAVEDGRHCRR